MRDASSMSAWHCSHLMAASLLLEKFDRLASLFSLCGFCKCCGILIKLLLTLRPAEVIGLSLIGGGGRGVFRIDFHSAHRITYCRRLARHESLLGLWRLA